MDAHSRINCISLIHHRHICCAMLLKTISHWNKRTVGRFYDDAAAAAAAVVVFLNDDDRDWLTTIMRWMMTRSMRLSSNLALIYWPSPIESGFCLTQGMEMKD